MTIILTPTEQADQLVPPPCKARGSIRNVLTWTPSSAQMTYPVMQRAASGHEERDHCGYILGLARPPSGS
jgi:hypothetical protein